MKNKKLIGLVGGLGPMAGNDVLRKLFEYSASRYKAVHDNEYPNVLLISEGLADFDETGHISPQFEKDILSVVDLLEVHNPTVMGIACNTAHVFAQKIQGHTDATFINIVEATVQEASKQQGRYLILSSSTTRKTGLYHKELENQHVDYLDVNDDEQITVDKIIGLVMASKLHEADKLAGDLIAKVSIKYPSATGIIAGCTELPLALNHTKMRDKFTVIDCNTCLAKALADAYYSI